MVVYVDINHYYIFDRLLINKFAKDIINKELPEINQPLETVDLIIAGQMERGIYIFNKLFDHILDYNFKTITLLIDYNIRKTFPTLLSKNILDNFIIIPINHWSLYCDKYLKQKNLNSTPWNWNNQKGLFLTGTLARYSRIGLLRRLYDLNLLDNILWTFPSPERQKSNILVRYYIDNSIKIPKDFNEFFSYCSENAILENKGILTDKFKNLSNLLPIFNNDEQVVSYYKVSNFTILSETLDNSITEKTYFAILHNHPFIVVNGPKVFLELKELGFKTFENYLPFSEYATIEDNDSRLNQIVENIRAFPKIIEERKEEISADIQHNYDLCIQIISQTESQLNNIFPTLANDIFSNGYAHAINKLGTDLYISYKNQEKILIDQEKEKEFLEKYNIIKGSDWPNISSEDEFWNLSTEIKKECKENFDFPPRHLSDKVNQLEGIPIDIL